MYDAEYVKSFYDAYGRREWERLEGSVAGRLKAIVHADFVRRYVGQGDRVLDAGCGPGRFTVTSAKLGAVVTALDLSEGQLELAKATVAEAGGSDAVEAFVAADIADLSMFADGHFDVVICYGGALSYVCERRHAAAAELVRVIRPGGILLVSVMSRLGDDGHAGPAAADVCAGGSRGLVRVAGRGTWGPSRVSSTGDGPGASGNAHVYE